MAVGHKHVTRRKKKEKGNAEQDSMRGTVGSSSRNSVHSLIHGLKKRSLCLGNMCCNLMAGIDSCCPARAQGVTPK
uniref:Uncharacterized protein n=1 Tax=Arundo donax TaxID=35708 RepID=A0A0A9BI40_ARUDO